MNARKQFEERLRALPLLELLARKAKILQDFKNAQTREDGALEACLYFHLAQLTKAIERKTYDKNKTKLRN